LILSIIKGET